jgi:hypothetical protein
MGFVGANMGGKSDDRALVYASVSQGRLSNHFEVDLYIVKFVHHPYWYLSETLR